MANEPKAEDDSFGGHGEDLDGESFTRYIFGWSNAAGGGHGDRVLHRP